MNCSNAQKQRLEPGQGYLPSFNSWAKRRETSDLVGVSDLINELLKCSKHNSGVGKTVASLWNFWGSDQV